MVPALQAGDSTLTEYEQVLIHLKYAQAAADQIGDQAAVGLIEMLQQLCRTRAGINSASSDQVQAPLASLSVHLFGTFQAFLDGTPVNSWRKKSESVFKYLIVHRAVPVHREKLFELFWPDLDPQPARNCLNVTLHALRQSLQANEALSVTDSLVQFSNDHYSLHPRLNVWTDIDAFTNYITLAQFALKHGDLANALAHNEMATALYRGHFLENDCYEEWTIQHRERLKSAYMTLLAQQSQLYYESGNFVQALDYSQKILEHDNCNEEAHCQIMRCYYALGRRGLALRQYQVFCDILTHVLGVSPMDETTCLYEQIKNGSFRRFPM
jgi:DNA-binding SARP family transcriptional activator